MAHSSFSVPLATTSVVGRASYNSTNFTVSGAGAVNTIQNIATGSSPTFAGLTVTAFSGAVSASAGVLSAGTLSVGNGGTGVATTPTNGAVPIGNGTNYTVAALTGTANQVTVTNGAGSITLAAPQNIHTAATPQFARLGLGAAADSAIPLLLEGNSGDGLLVRNLSTDLANKAGAILGSQYDSLVESEGFLPYGYLSTSGANRVQIGGGSGNRNAATSIEFLTAANVTTRTGTERGRITSDGAMLIGGTSAYGRTGTLFEVNAASANDVSTSIQSWGTTDRAAILDLSVARSGTVGTHTSGGVTNGQQIGYIFFRGSDGSVFRNHAAIGAFVDGAASAGDAPGRLTFYTTTDGAGDVTERMRITSAGNVGVGTSTFGTSAAGVFSIANGTAPSTGPADTVQFYSSDDAAGHTIPSFYCEGTNVVATGQADSASSVRVKMRINGTVYTFLCI